MRLSELQPKWLTPNVLIFLCPHCKKDWLSCKNIPMSFKEQYDLFEKEFGEDWNMRIVPCDQQCSWTFSTQDFETISIAPSVDASGSGHWHGSIANGNII